MVTFRVAVHVKQVIQKVQKTSDNRSGQCTGSLAYFWVVRNPSTLYNGWTTEKMTLRRAALIAGLGYILMFGMPIAGFMAFQKLVDFNNTQGTVHNIITNIALFRYGIFFYFINFLGDVIAAWAIYILLAPP